MPSLPTLTFCGTVWTQNTPSLMSLLTFYFNFIWTWWSPSSTLKSSLNLNLSPLQIKFLDQYFFFIFLNSAILAEGRYSTNNCLFFKYLKKTLSIYHVANTISIFDHGDPVLYTRQSPGLSWSLHLNWSYKCNVRKTFFLKYLFWMTVPVWFI